MGARVPLGGLIVSVILGVAPARAIAGPTDDAPAADAAEPDVGVDEPVVKDPKVAKRWLAAAEQLTKRGDYLSRKGRAADAQSEWERAVVAYAKAIAAGDDANLYLPLASLEEKLGRLPDAVAHYRAVAAGAKIRPDVAKQAADKLDAVTAKVGLVALVIAPAGATISRDGVVIGTAPLAAPLVFAPGKYTLTFAADGFQPKDLEVKIDAGSETERKVELEPVPVAFTPPPPPSSREGHVAPVPRTAPERWPLLVGAGATGGLAVTATITGILAVRRHSTYVAAASTSDQRASAKSSGQTLARVTDACLIGTVVGAAVTAYYYLQVYRGHASAHEEVTKVEVAPWVQPDTGGLVIAGKF